MTRRIPWLRTTKCFILSTALVEGSCSFKEMGRDVGEGLSSGLEKHADSLSAKLGSGIVRGARDTLTSEESQRKLKEFVEESGESLRTEAGALRDSLLGARTKSDVRQLVQQITGEETKKNVGAIRDELLGEKTVVRLREIRNELLGDSTKAKLGALRNELLGAATRSVIDSLVKDAVVSLAREYEEKLKPIVREEEGFIKRHATELMWTAGGVLSIVLVIAALLFIRRKKEQKILKVLTEEIENIGDKKVHEDVTKKISKKAVQEGVEPHLRDLLRKEGILK